MSRSGQIFRLCFALTGIVASGSAFARKAPPPPAPPETPAYSWSGFYVGANLGYGIGSASATESSFSAGLAGTPLLTNAPDLGVSGVIGGGQIGYDWQTAPTWLVGVEADFQGSGQRGSGTFTNPFASVADGVQVDNKWFGTVRGRVGYIQDNTNLWYVTGGFAFGRDELKLSETNGFFPASPTSGTFSKTNGGWTLGGGVESHLFGNWTAKIEYLYMDLGTISGTSQSFAPFFVGGPLFLASGITASAHIHDNIVRAGLNYKF